jgi:hypothetical protein
LSRRKVRDNPLRNVLREVKCLFKSWFWWLRRGDDEKFYKSQERPSTLFKKSMFGFCSYLGFVVLLFNSEYPNFWEFRRIVTFHWIYKVDHTKDGSGSL